MSVPRYAYDGVEALDDKIYFVGGWAGNAKSITERYDPSSGEWQTLSPMSEPRQGMASAVLNDKLYAIGGQDLSSVEVYDPKLEQWSLGTALPSEVNHGQAISFNGKILLFGGRDSADQELNQVLEYNPVTDLWTQKPEMSLTRQGHKLTLVEGKIWVIGGYSGHPSKTSSIEIYDPQLDSWSIGPTLSKAIAYPMTWTERERLYIAGGVDENSLIDSVDYFDLRKSLWFAGGRLLENKYIGDSTILNNKVYLIGGKFSGNNSDVSNKVYAADLLPHRDLFFRSVASETVNREPTSIFALGDLNISENQPSGTIVGEFNATDPDGDSVTYSLVSGEGDGGNSFFTLDANGTLKTATTFDYESNASAYSIRVQAKDEFNATVERSFAVTLTDDIYEDTDGDGFSDAQEVSGGTDPNDAANKPGLDFGLVAWYPFDGNASDMSGYENHGSVYGASFIDHLSGQALEFVADEHDYVEMPHASQYDFGTGEFTLNLWVKGKTQANYGAIFIKASNPAYPYEGITLFLSQVPGNFRPAPLLPQSFLRSVTIWIIIVGTT